MRKFSRDDRAERALLNLKPIVRECRGRILAFAADAQEPDVLSVLREGAYLPRILEGSAMEFRLARPEELTPGKFGILQPPAENPRFVPPAGPNDLVIVPALAVNKEGCRLGRGGGYYDRMREVLQGARVVAVLPDSLAGMDFPSEDHDLRVTTVVTETGIHEQRNF